MHMHWNRYVGDKKRPVKLMELEQGNGMTSARVHDAMVPSNKTAKGNKTGMIVIIHRSKLANCLGRMCVAAYFVC